MSELPPSSNLYIPSELLREISYCTTPTLASVCKVSQACLELASPFLYTHIVVHSVKTAVMLFLFDTTSPPSSPLACLPRVVFPLSRIKTFTYAAQDRLHGASPTGCLEFFDPRISQPNTLSPTPLPPPLELDVFVLSLSPNSGSNHLHRSANERGSNVLQLFNPSTFVLRGRLPTEKGRTSSIASLECAFNYQLLSNNLFSWNRLSSLVLNNAACNLLYSREARLRARARREGRPCSFTVYLDCLDAPSWDLTRTHSGVTWEAVAEIAQLVLDEGSVLSSEVVVWVETEEEKEELVKLVKKGAEDAFLEGYVSAAFEVQVEVHPSRIGRRDREDGWAGRSIESWR